MKNLKFPKGFYFGASTSSHQVEGGNHNDWTEWEKSDKRINFLNKRGLIPKYGLDNFISGKACDHYHKFREDFKLIKDLGHNAHRFGIEWSRIEPEEGKFDQKELEHYHEVVRTLKNLNIEPFVTLWHWTIPLWFRDKGGFKSQESTYYFNRYCEKVVDFFKDDIRFWITINEPEIYTAEAYFQGIRPPQEKNPISYWIVLRNLIKAHKEVYKTIKKINPNAQVGIAKNNSFFEAENNNLINKALKNIFQWWWNEYFLNQIKYYQDFIGLNHYFHSRINYGRVKNSNTVTSDLGWELHPRSIYYTLLELKRYNKPIYLTENGLADAADKKRGWFILQNVNSINLAMKKGVDVRGYLHWSLMDNFEWESGFRPRFGLIEIDYTTLKRKIRPSAYVLKAIAQGKEIDSKMLKIYG